MTNLLTEANGYAWHLVDATSYDSILNWFVISCDPRIILMDERSEYFQLDSVVLRYALVDDFLNKTFSSFQLLNNLFLFIKISGFFSVAQATFQTPNYSIQQH